MNALFLNDRYVREHIDGLITDAARARRQRLELPKRRRRR